jgi:CheY-like chemotaxis protein
MNQDKLNCCIDEARQPISATFSQAAHTSNAMTGCSATLETAPSAMKALVAPSVPVYRERAKLSERTIRVMLVDDHQLMREGLRKIIADDPRLALVAEAGDGEAAVEAALHVQPDVIIMDVRMPKMSGIDATRRITEENPQIKVIGLSLSDDQGTLQSMKSAGAVAYLTKDIAFEALCETIRQIADIATQPEFFVQTVPLIDLPRIAPKIDLR